MRTISMELPVSAVACDDDEGHQLARLTGAMARMCDDAWREFHWRYYDRLLGYALTLHSGERATAEDSLQSGFLRVVRHIRRFDDEDVFWSWLTLLVRCAAADQGRKIAARSRLHEALMESSRTENPVTTARDENAFVLLDEALSRVAKDDRLLLRGKYVDGESLHELAECRGISEKAVECRLRRLRKQLKSTIHALARNTRA